MNIPNKKEGSSTGRFFAAARGFFKNKKKKPKHTGARLADEHAEHLGVGASSFVASLDQEYHSHQGVNE